MYLSKIVIALALTLICYSPNAAAMEKGDWQVRLGVHMVEPKSDNNAIVEVDGATSVTFDITYRLNSNWAVELLAALPFTHDIALVGGATVGETDQLPPTISMQYHFMPNGRVHPYVGAGVNWTMFFKEDLFGPLAGSKLVLDDSIGLAGQFGVDFDLQGPWFVNVVARYIQISTDAEIDGVSIGDVELDPWAFSLSMGRRF